MLNNFDVVKFNFPNLGLGYYIITIFFLSTLLLKSRGSVDTKIKEKYEGILLSVSLSIFIFLLICITITDIDLFKDAMLYNLGLPHFLSPLFKYIGIYRNLIVVLILLVFLIIMIIYLYLEYIVWNKSKNKRLVFFALVIFAVFMEIYDFGAHYVKDLINKEMAENFSTDFHEIINASEQYKYLIDVNRQNLPPYTDGSVKALSDFATYHNLKSNIGIYSRNQEIDKVISNKNVDVDERYQYEIRDDTIYIFEGPCFMECKNYVLTYYLVNNYLIGVKNPFDRVEKYDQDILYEEQTSTVFELDPIIDINAFLEKYSKHEYEIIDDYNYVNGKTHAMIHLQCKYCEHAQDIFNRGNGHIFTEYVNNNDAKANVHGTKTAKCICDEKISEPTSDDILGHKYEMQTLRTPTNAEPGLRALSCAICGKILTGTEKYTFIEIEYENVVYDGKPHIPYLKIKDIDGNVMDESLYELEYSDVVEVGPAIISVTFKDTGNEDLQPFIVYYYIKPLNPEIISASSDNEVMTIKYIKPSSSYDGIDIAYSDYEDFDDAYTKHFDVSNKNKEEISIKNIDGNKRYVKIRAYKKIIGQTKMIYSDWSETLLIE